MYILPENANAKPLSLAIVFVENIWLIESWNLHFAPCRPNGTKYCDQRVCLYVSLSVSSRISKAARSNFTKYTLHVICGRGTVLYSDGNVIFYIFQVLWIMLCFRIIKRIGHNQRRRLCRPVRQVAALKENACRLKLHLVRLETAKTWNVAESVSRICLRVYCWNGGSKTDGNVGVSRFPCLDRAALRLPTATQSNKFRWAANAVRLSRDDHFSGDVASKKYMHMSLKVNNWQKLTKNYLILVLFK